MKDKKILWVIIACIVIILIPNGFYMYHFACNGWSTDPAQWGQYGDYLGGFINPILSAANIVALVYLTYTVSEAEEKRIKQQQVLETQRANENITAQKIITLTQMRHSVVSELAIKLSSVGYATDMLNGMTILEDTAGAIIFFRNHNSYLFKNLIDDKFDDNFINPLLNCIDEFRTSLIQGGNVTEEEGKKILIKYIELESIFIAELNEFILEEISVK